MNRIMKVITFTVMLTCTLVIAFNLFVAEVSGVGIETLFAFTDSLFMILITFMYCYLSEWVTSDLLEIGDLFYNSAWYRLPVKQQRLLTLPIGRAQREFRLSGLGLFDCSLALFSSVEYSTLSLEYKF